ncbi:retrovirus-related Pol polyprotein from transposon TNT 1-94 isoform X6 [Actinidia eriantha]|uniref:retrovirus-related Pol polyprotein from transposon TNT 1-94 isoform X6 n=1 Tax=Actinidia eriantha TaxID=165200 RepID=UPI0025835547|nr:retrovirus-related Pol polyprotein from transposon TNT 1-94 isoform X6 [Actinidia eriantha]XP_057478146.1 retrovirus-related Pol polyprotein from transposon TNT 1-94 isoform X6 [Actinidia eriantha]
MKVGRMTLGGLLALGYTVVVSYKRVSTSVSNGNVSMSLETIDSLCETYTVLRGTNRKTVGAEASRMGINGPWITKSYLEMILERKGVPRINTPPLLPNASANSNQETLIAAPKPLRITPNLVNRLEDLSQDSQPWTRSPTKSKMEPVLASWHFISPDPPLADGSVIETDPSSFRDTLHLIPMPDSYDLDRGLLLAVQAIQALLENKGLPVIVGIGGPSGSGKTSLARKMANIVGCEVFSLENYYKSEQVKDFKYDEFNSLDLALLSKNFDGIRNFRRTKVPIFDLETGTRSGFKEVEVSEDCGVVIFEGVYALHPDIRKSLDLWIAVVGGVHSHLISRVQRDKSRVGCFMSQNEIMTTVFPMFQQHIEPHLVHAHLKIRNDFDPVLSPESSLFVLKSKKQVAYQDILRILDSTKICSSVQNFTDVYFRLPGMPANGVQLAESDCIRVRICEGRFALLIREPIREGNFIVQPKVDFDISICTVAGLLNLGYKAVAYIEASAYIYQDGKILIEVDHLQDVPSTYLQIKGVNKEAVAAAGSTLKLDGSYTTKSYLQIILERLPVLERSSGGIQTQQAARLQELVEFIQSQELKTGKVIGSGKAHGGLYFLESAPHSPMSCGLALQADKGSAISMLHQWHRRLGHPSFGILEKLFPNLVKHCSRSQFFCEACELGKHKRSFYAPINKRSDSPFMVIHSDVWASPIPSLKGHRWFVTFIDCFSRVTWVYLLKSKSEVFSCFKSFHAMVRTQFDSNIKILRSDNGTEYIDTSFRAFLDDNGILFQTTCVGTPQQNGVAERKNRHLAEVARSLLFTMNVPKYLWGEAILTAAYLINRMPSSVLNFKTPIECLPSHFHVTSLPPRVFGCVCFVHALHPSGGKFGPKAHKCGFIGYSPTQKGYKCYDPSSRKFLVSMDVTFWETESFFSPSTPSLQGEHKQEEEMFSSEGEKLFDDHRDRRKEKSEEEPISPEKATRDIGSDKEASPHRLQGSNLKTYTRREKGKSSCMIPPCQLQSPASVPNSLGDSSGNDSSSIEPPLINSVDLPIALRKGVRSCTQHPISQFVSYDRLSPSYHAFVSSLSSISIPQNWQDAVMTSKWKGAMVEEMMALKKNGTWELVSLPREKKPVGCKWIFTVKHNADGTVERYKARLVAKGFTQTYGIDYEETFAPVAKMNSVRALLSCAATLKWHLHQFDVKNTFLHGELEEEVYMDIPPGFSSSKTEGKVCRLKKALYGLKQSPRAWFGRFSKAMLGFGYKQSHADHTMFIKKGAGKIIVLIVYVDDMIVTGDDVDEILNLKCRLAQEFEIKDLGSLRYFLGMEVARSDRGIFISQRKYILDLLEETGMLGCKPVNSPIEANHHLSGDMGERTNKERYQRLVGRLIYLAHTRPDVSYAVDVVSQFMHDPRTSHMDAVYRILSYLKSAPGKGIMFSNHGHLQLEVFTDADWAGSVDDRRSTSGYCTFLGGNLVTWRSKKQSVVARSSAKAEYRAMAHGVCELLWLQTLLHDLGVLIDGPMKLYCDNKAAINIAHNPVQHDRTKHIEIDRHFIKEKLSEGLICMPFVKSEDQLADIFTKGLSSKSFHPIVFKLGMIDIFAPT